MTTKNDFILRVELKQHTPILHFQDEQDGATLRATEVKPKLDRFLIEYFKKNDISYKHWLVGRGHNNIEALDYKLKIKDRREKKSKYYTYRIISEPTEGVLSNSLIDINFFSFHKDLIQIIQGKVDSFFVLHNFGKRQSKGFGCYLPFTIKNVNKLESILKNTSKIAYKADGKCEVQKFYTHIENNWRDLKSGSNHREYYKSLLFKHMIEKGIRWEKRIIKQCLNNMIKVGTLREKLQNRGNLLVDGVVGEDRFKDDLDNYFGWQDNPEIDYNYHFVRAFLGLAEHYEFRANNRYVYQVIIVPEKGVERFKSPVTFKFFEGITYAIAEPQKIKYIQGKKFKFEVQVKKNKEKIKQIPLIKPNGTQLELTTPDSFDLIEFLDDFMPVLEYKRI